MQKALIIGATGMLGHKALQVLSQSFTVAGTVRGAPEVYCSHAILRNFRLLGNVNAECPGSIERAIAEFQPDVVVNCAALTADKITDANKAVAILVNSVLPHELARICARKSIFFVHISTDAVFSGARGPYRETDTPDPIDFYGRTKQMGEIDGPNSLTIRASIFGRQIFGHNGLVEWLKTRRQEKIKGFTNALFTGLPTIVLCRLIRDIAIRRAGLHGIVHIASSPISKYDLLRRLNLAMGLGITIEPVDTPAIDRRLAGDVFTERSGLKVPEWQDLIDAFVADEKCYREVSASSRRPSCLPGTPEI